MSPLCKLSLVRHKSIQVIQIMDTSCSTKALPPITRVKVKKTALDLRWLGILIIWTFAFLLFPMFTIFLSFSPFFQPVGRAVKYQ